MCLPPQPWKLLLPQLPPRGSGGINSCKRNATSKRGTNAQHEPHVRHVRGLSDPAAAETYGAVQRLGVWVSVWERSQRFCTSRFVPSLRCWSVWVAPCRCWAGAAAFGPAHVARSGVSLPDKRPVRSKSRAAANQPACIGARLTKPTSLDQVVQSVVKGSDLSSCEFALPSRWKTQATQFSNS